MRSINLSVALLSTVGSLTMVVARYREPRSLHRDAYMIEFEHRYLGCASSIAVKFCLARPAISISTTDARRASQCGKSA
jgi:hypothetical protein